MKNIPSEIRTRYEDNGKLISLSTAHEDAIVKANAKYIGAKRFRIIPTNGTV